MDARAQKIYHQPIPEISGTKHLRGFFRLYLEFQVIVIWISQIFNRTFMPKRIFFSFYLVKQALGNFVISQLVDF